MFGVLCPPSIDHVLCMNQKCSFEMLFPVEKKAFYYSMKRFSVYYIINCKFVMQSHVELRCCSWVPNDKYIRLRATPSAAEEFKLQSWRCCFGISCLCFAAICLFRIRHPISESYAQLGIVIL